MTDKKSDRTKNNRNKLMQLGALLIVTILSIIVLPQVRTFFNTNAAVENQTSAKPVSLLKQSSTWKTHKNFRYSNAIKSSSNLMDVYVPNNGVEHAPLIILIHATTAWNTGDKADCAGDAQTLVKKGFVVACPNYRLANEASWPAQIIDIKTSIRALRANAKTFHIYPYKIGVWGFSAAGQLSLMTGLSGNKTEWDKGEWNTYSSSVQAVQANGAPTNLTTWIKNPCCKIAEPFLVPFVGDYITRNPVRANYASPTSYVRPNSPPIVIVHGDKDTAVPVGQAYELYNALKKNGAPVSMRIIPGMGHQLEPSKTHINNMVAFFDAHLRR